MGDRSAIEWTEATWNPIVGCSVVSPGCANCYAMKMAARIERMAACAGKWTHYNGTTQASKAGPVWTGRLTLAPEWLDEQVATAMHLAPDAAMFDRFGAPKGPKWHPYEASDRNGGALICVGKKAAGRLLDGREHSDMPEARPL